MAQADEQEWLIRAKQGDTAAFTALVRRYQTAIFNVAYRFFHNRQDAEDAAQEAFVRAFRGMDTFDVTRPFAPWIKRITANHCLNRLQAAKIRPSVPVTDLAAPGTEAVTLDKWAHPSPTPEQSLLKQEQAGHIRVAIAALPPRYRTVIELRHFQQMAYDEIAAVMERPLSTVKSDLFRARKMLRKLMSDA